MHCAVHLSHGVLDGVHAVQSFGGLLQDGQGLDRLDVEVFE